MTKSRAIYIAAYLLAIPIFWLVLTNQTAGNIFLMTFLVLAVSGPVGFGVIFLICGWTYVLFVTLKNRLIPVKP